MSFPLASGLAAAKERQDQEPQRDGHWPSAHKAQRHLGATRTNNNKSIDAVEQKNANLNLREALSVCLFSLTRGATLRTYPVTGEEARARRYILY